MARHRLQNIGKAVQGFHVAGVPTYVRPGETVEADISAEEARLFGLPGSGVNCVPIGEARLLTSPVPPGAQDFIAGRVDASLAAEEALEGQLRGETTAPAPAPAPAPAVLAPANTPEDDAFDAMTDDELRIFITDRDEKAPHHLTGRPKLLKIAREGAAPPQAPDEDEAV